MANAINNLVSKQVFMVSDFKSLPMGVCKVSRSDSEVRISTSTKHYFFNNEGDYICRKHRKRAVLATRVVPIVGAICADIVFLAYDAKKDACRKVAILFLEEEKMIASSGKVDFTVC